MRRWLPVLAVLAGLGSLISCKQSPPISHLEQGSRVETVEPSPKPVSISSPSIEPDPFTRYFVNSRAGWPEQALVRFAAQCKLDIKVVRPHYAQRSGEGWIPVNGLSDPRSSQGKLAAWTVTVWHTDDRALVELWTVGADPGDYSRDLYCFNKRKVTFADQVSWKIDMHKTRVRDTTWGFEERWRVGPNGDDVSTLRQFVDPYERPTKIPGVSPYSKDDVDNEGLEVLTWSDLILPDSLLNE